MQGVCAEGGVRRTKKRQVKKVHLPLVFLSEMQMYAKLSQTLTWSYCKVTVLLTDMLWPMLSFVLSPLMDFTQPSSPIS